MKRSSKHATFVIMGVSGSGKSEVAKAIAYRLNCAALDGDFLHPKKNILKMAAGQPLNDADRQPWLHALNEAIFAMQRTQAVSLLVCSALKRAYRDQLRAENQNVFFLYLKGDQAVIAERLSQRKGHFFKPELLASQFATLEAPSCDEPDVRTIDIHASLETVIEQSLAAIQEISERAE